MGGVADAIGGLFGGGADAAGDAADAQVQSGRDNIAFQQQLFNALQGVNSYQTGIGNQALGLMGSLYGLTPGYNPAGSYSFQEGAPAGPAPSFSGPLTGPANTLFQQQNRGDGMQLVHTPGGPAPGNTGTPQNIMNMFANMPGYQFSLQQGNKALGQNQAARGNLFSGGAAKEMVDYNQGMASQQFGNEWNRLAGLAGVGQAGTQATGNALQNVGNNIGNSITGMGDARASGYLGQYQAGQNSLNNILGIAGTAAMFCDRRLKKNVEFTGMRGPYKWYRFTYADGSPGEGPMADEVREINPEAVGEVGVSVVFPGKL